ncbi:GNAT family N-acetyltransferase [Nocardioides pacificus]
MSGASLPDLHLAVLDLPAGLTQRPMRLEDAAIVTALLVAEEMHDLGVAVLDEADVVSDWQRPSHDLASSTVGVFDGDDLVACAELSGPDRATVGVHPSHRGRGIGTCLADWVQRRARAGGSDVVGMPVPQGSPGDQLLASLGFHVRWTSWVLELPAGRVVEAQPLPEGYGVREAAADEHPAVWTVVEDAFLEWASRSRQSYDDFAAQVMRRPGFEPWNLRVVTDPAGDVVGAAFVLLSEGCGFIDRLAVRSDQRGRGLARALLADSFAAARAHGATRSELSTDSRTGALGLYERVGMEVTSTWVNRAIHLQ